MALGPGRPPFRRGNFNVTVPRRVLTPDGRVVLVNDQIRDHLVPIPFEPDTVKNIFEPGRAGRPVVRPEDLLALRIELKNILITPGSPPRLTAQGNAAKLILHFPPQAITEETFFEVPPPDFEPPAEGSEGEHPHPYIQEKPEPASGSDPLRKPPIRARVADESRLVFKVPAGTVIDYTLEAILAACAEFEMVVAANARPRSVRRRYFRLKDLFDRNVLQNLAPKSRAALAAQAIGALRISSAAGSGDIVTLRARQARGGRVFREVPDDLTGAITRPTRYRPRPKRPSATTTAIELPWRLIISPHSGARWRHATTPASSEFTGRTELWHTRMVTPQSDGNEIMPPNPDPNRTIRAIWARSGTGWEAMQPPMQGNWPDPTAELPNPKALPKPGTNPFRMPMDNFDRCQVVHLSSNFSVTDYRPEAVDTNLLMLSSLGGWLDSRGAWDPPGLSVEEWVHRASMARDHYVKVVYRGFLFPFGHRVSLVKVSERKFHNGGATSEQEPGNPAYLRQRYFLIIREKIRTFDDALFRATKSKDHSVVFANQFPFSRVEILLDSTPDLNKPEDDEVAGKGQLMFWPNVGGSPFRFPCVGTDLDGRRVAFDLPMIFLDNTQACPRYFDEDTETLKAGFYAAEENARLAKDAYDQAPGKNNADFDGQRLALAAPLKSGDTSVEAIDVVFGGETSETGLFGNTSLRNYSNDLSRPVFVPKIVSVKARIGVMANLTGTADTNSLTWNAHFLRHGFNKDASQEPNCGEVFVDVAGQGKMDFSSQGDKSGGFMQPNLKPLALSRSAGPVTSDVQNFIDGKLDPGAGFSDVSLADLPLPLLFGCIPLAKIIQAVTSHLDEPEKVPKFVQEGGSQVETFINTLVRLYGMVHDLVTDPASVAQGLIDQAKLTLNDQVAQSQAYATALVQPVVQKINELDTAITQVKSRLQALAGLAIDTVDSAPDFISLPTDVANARARIAELKTLANAQVNGVSLPAGFRQSVLNLCDKLDKGLEALEDLATLIAAGKELYEALDAIVGDPAGLGDLFSDSSALSAKLDEVADAVGIFRTALAGFDLLNGAVKTTLLNALQDLEDIFNAVGTLIELLAGDELTIRFDWNPEISSFPTAQGKEIFRANDKRGLLVAVEGKVKKNGSSTPKISVVCSLRSFDLVLIAPASFIELQFDRIEFSVDSKAKMDVDVLLNEIKFVGPLSFVETLKDLIPLDGFSDPPYLDITPRGIDAGFDIALPTVAVGVLNISNLSLGAGFTVPFIGQPLAVRFNFCTREQPFQLTVYMFGGGGFFGVTIDPSGVQILEAAFEFGAAISVNFGVASGGVEVMAGIYFRIENDNAMLAGYFRLGGHVDVLGLITASLELYLELSYETSSGKCKGMAQLTIEISVFIFSGSVTITCERKFAGANGDPSLRQMMGLNPALTLEDELDLINGPGVDYAWRDYVEAFA
jgi:hypothetical protein